MDAHFQVASVNHTRGGGRRLCVVGNAYCTKDAINVVLTREPRSNLLRLIPHNTRKEENCR